MCVGWGQRSEYKPRLKESTLSSQSEADSTRRDGVRGKEYKHSRRMSRVGGGVNFEICVSQQSHNSTKDGDQRGWRSH